tara:strand:+ start:5131 stop:5454 length:324 start_codon:yes stop_codon:yes gene_type:complete
MTYEILLRILNAKNPEALLLEPRNIYDPCVVDITNKPEDHWNRASTVWVAVYDAQLCVEAIVQSLMEEEEPRSLFEAYDAATDYFSHNVAGCWDGENTPCFFYSEEN